MLTRAQRLERAEQYRAQLRANVGTTHVNQPLSDFATGYLPGVYVGDLMMPPIPTQHFSDTFYQRRLYDIITPVEDLIGPSGVPNEVDYQHGTASYVCVDRGLMGWVPWKEIEDADDVLAPREEQTRIIMNKLLLAAEIRVANFLDTNTNYATANRITATADWSNTTTGNPVKDMQDAIASIAVGDESSILRCCLSLELWQEAQRHPQLTGLLGANDRGLVRKSDFEEFFGVQLVLTDAQKNTAARLAAETVTKARIWSTSVVRIVRVPTSIPSKTSLMFAARFRKRTGGGENDTMVTEWMEPARGVGEGSVGIKITRSESDPATLQNDAGAIITGA